MSEEYMEFSPKKSKRFNNIKKIRYQLMKPLKNSTNIFPRTLNDYPFGINC